MIYLNQFKILLRLIFLDILIKILRFYLNNFNSWITNKSPELIKTQGFYFLLGTSKEKFGRRG